MEQRDLVERAGRGDHDAFEVLVERSIAHLDALARLCLRDRELARDAVQEAYMRAWRDLPGVRDPDRFDAWLHRLTVNACLDIARRRQRRPREVTLLSIPGLVEGDVSAGVADRDEMAQAFSRLSPEQRAVLVLHYYVGMAVPAVAEALEIPLGTAQSRLGRALVSLRAALAPGAADARRRHGRGEVA